MIGKGCVIAIGGNEDKRGQKSILREFVRRAGAANARIVIIPSASVAPEQRAVRYSRIFARLGVASVCSIHPERKVTPDDLVLVTNATGIFVTGGDQERLMTFLRPTGVANAIVEAVRNGAVYAGTSAGASALSGRMITGSTRSRGTDIVEFGDGLGLLPTIIVDQHFSERRRLTRLISASREHHMIGVGIDENTAMVLDGSGRIGAIGAGEITVVRPERESIRLHMLGDSEEIDLD
ncbi:MAG TPA: cyanophycinase [Thermoanaerobaculia bacterium]|nr:cyanophycinase [Thermoanaerobaculia bacterium]